MVSHICLLVELGPICNSTAASLCLKSCVDHSLLKSYNGGLWKNIYRSGPRGVIIDKRNTRRVYFIENTTRLLLSSPWTFYRTAKTEKRIEKQSAVSGSKVTLT